MLQPNGEDRLLRFAGNRALLRQEDVLGELLRQRRAALHLAGGEVAESRAQDADGVDAEMRIEAPVLDGDERLRNVGRQLLDRDGAAAGFAAIGHEGPVRRQDRHIGRALRHGQLVDRRQLHREIGDDGGERDHAPERGDGAELDQFDHEGAAGPLAPRLRDAASAGPALGGGRRAILAGDGEAVIAPPIEAGLDPPPSRIAVFARQFSISFTRNASLPQSGPLKLSGLP